MRNKLLVTGIIFCISTSILYAQFGIEAELRPRAELRDGYKELPDSGDIPAFFISQRTRLGVNYKHEKYTAKISLQDIRVWGDENYYSSTAVLGDTASIDIKEAWAEIFLSDRFAVKIGRQELKYNDQRFLAGRNWNQHGVSYDAVLLKYKNKLQLDVCASYNNNEENVFGTEYSTGKFKTFNFIYFQTKISETFDINVLGIATGYQKPDKPEKFYLKNTIGGGFIKNMHEFTLKSDGYYQFGENNDGDNVSAYFFDVLLNYKYKKIDVSGGVDYISGQDNTITDSTDHRFDMLYGARHSYYGTMDYFSNLNKATSGGGLIDIFLKANYAFNEKISANSEYHYFSLQNKVIDPVNSTQVLSKNLGFEFDFKLTCKINKDITIETGYSFMLPTNSLKKLQNINISYKSFPQWAWIMCTIKPSVFLEKNN